MKTIMTKAIMLIAVLMFGVATLGSANGASVEETVAGDFKYVTYVVKNKQQFVFAYASKSVQRVSLVIRDVEGNELHRDFFVEKEVGRVYDLSKYGNGTYFLEVKTGDFYEKERNRYQCRAFFDYQRHTLENKKVALTYRIQQILPYIFTSHATENRV
jgi:hypothetical protein